MQVTEGNGYPGGKGASGLAGWILRQLPSHTAFIEPFAGKAAVTRAKSLAMQTILSDLSPEVCAWLKRNISFASVSHSDGLHLIAQLSSRTVPHWPNNLTVWPVGQGVDRPSSLVAIPAAEDVVVYCDPPYVHASRSKMQIYDFEWSDAEHERFLKLIQKVDCPVAISGYSSDMYLAALSDWTMTTTQSQTRGGLRTECLWRNPLCVNAVARGSTRLAREYSELGEHWRDRDRVSRLVSRWSKNFARRPAVERDAILRQLLDIHRQTNGEM